MRALQIIYVFQKSLLFFSGVSVKQESDKITFYGICQTGLLNEKTRHIQLQRLGVVCFFYFCFLIPSLYRRYDLPYYVGWGFPILGQLQNRTRAETKAENCRNQGDPASPERSATSQERLTDC